jgi:HK97 gp10 family phage protein
MRLGWVPLYDGTTKIMATRRRLGRSLLTKKAIEFEGIAEIAANAKKLMIAAGYQGADVAQELKKSLMVGALIVRDEARHMVPVDTGLLRDSIFAAYGKRDKADVLVGVNTRQAVTTSAGGKTRTYAGVVEFGDDSHPPQPFMRPAIAAARPTVARVVSDALRVAVDRLANKLL